MTSHHIVNRQEWIAARTALLEQEKAHTRARDELAKARRALPWVRVETNYRFNSEAGEVGLIDLFAGNRQLVVQHFMFGRDWAAGCKSCSFWIDNLEGIQPHLSRRDTALVLVSTAPLEKLLTFRTRMGWTLPWASSENSAFNSDFGVTFTAQELESGDFQYNYRKGAAGGPEAPGASCFYRDDDGTIYHTYSTYGRGLDHYNGAYQIMDLTPLGRNESDYSYPMEWVRLHDEYET